jgi:hypothetical protein
MYQARLIASLLEHARDKIFLADMRLANVFDGHPLLGGQ